MNLSNSPATTANINAASGGGVNQTLVCSLDPGEGIAWIVAGTDNIDAIAGPPGPQGPQDPQGVQGKIGPQNVQGKIGPQGPLAMTVKTA